MRRGMFPTVIAFSCVLAGISVTGAQAQQTRKVYVSVTEQNGTPVTNLTAADFEVKEGDQPREVVSAQLTTTPIRMAIVVADGGTGGYQVAAVTLVQALQNIAEFAIVSVVEQPDKIVNFTNDIDAVVTGLKRLGKRVGKPGTGQVMEAIADVARDVGRPDKRPVIVVLTYGGSVASSLRAAAVREELRKAGTVLYVISPVGSGGGPGASAGGGGGGNMGTARDGYAASESASRGRDLEIVLNDGSKDTGGRHDQVNPQTLLKTVEQIAQELLNQYQLSYTLPDGVKPSDKLEVSSKRKGLKVNAPSRIAN